VRQKPFQYIIDYYDVPACIGRRVVIAGEPGIIVADRGQYIGVTLDSDKPNTVNNYHPTDHVVYGEMGIPRKPTRAQQRWMEYKEVADCFPDGFRDYLRYLKHKKEGQSV
jgi:hypothetical protein